MILTKIGLALAIASLSTTSLGSDSSAQKAIDIELTGNFSQTKQDQIRDWLQQGLTAVEFSLAPLPADSVNFSVVKYKSASQAVPWGQIVRGSPDTVKLYVASNANQSELVNDWTLYHELSHLYLPYLDYSSFWLSEGFATYMQYIVMYQAGLLSKQQTITRMAAGFSRGQKNAKIKSGKLSEVASNMWQMRAYRRVYWSGAGFFVEADLALAKHGKSLSEVMARFANCCLTEQSTGRALIADLDRISQSNVFSTLFDKYKNREDFPQISKHQLSSLLERYPHKSPDIAATGLNEQ